MAVFSAVRVIFNLIQLETRIVFIGVDFDENFTLWIPLVAIGGAFIVFLILLANGAGQ